jgi:hypothetical protein
MAKSATLERAQRELLRPDFAIVMSLLEEISQPQPLRSAVLIRPAPNKVADPRIVSRVQKDDA